MSDFSVCDCLIIGKGPAGLQAAIYVARAGFRVVVTGRDSGSLEKAEKIENYFGLPQPLSGVELIKTGEAQVRSLGAEIYDDQVFGFGYTDDGNYTAQTAYNEYAAKTVLLATGMKRAKAPVRNLTMYEGKGVSYCAVCDGFLYRGKKAGVLGFGEYALFEARELIPHVGRVTIFTNGEAPYHTLLSAAAGSAGAIEVNAGKIDKLDGGERLTGVNFTNGGYYALDGLFVAYGDAGGDALAKKLGVMLNNNGEIVVDDKQATNVPGVFAAGDCTGAFRQIAVAVGQGAVAARSAIEYIRNI